MSQSELRIFKYRLDITDEQQVRMPLDARVLSLGLDPAEAVCIWAMVNPRIATIHNYDVRIVGTGNPFDNTVELMDFLGTVNQDSFMWHVFLDPTGYPIHD